MPTKIFARGQETNQIKPVYTENLILKNQFSGLVFVLLGNQEIKVQPLLNYANFEDQTRTKADTTDVCLSLYAFNFADVCERNV